MVLGGRLIFTLVLQCIALSLANQNLVPIFISKIGKPFISLESKNKGPPPISKRNSLIKKLTVLLLKMNVVD